MSNRYSETSTGGTIASVVIAVVIIAALVYFSRDTPERRAACQKYCADQGAPSWMLDSKYNNCVCVFSTEHKRAE